MYYDRMAGDRISELDNKIEALIDNIIARGYRDRDPLLQEHVLESLQFAQAAYEGQEYELCQELLLHCALVDRCRSYVLEPIKARA